MNRDKKPLLQLPNAFMVFSIGRPRDFRAELHLTSYLSLRMSPGFHTISLDFAPCLLLGSLNKTGF